MNEREQCVAVVVVVVMNLPVSQMEQVPCKRKGKDRRRSVSRVIGLVSVQLATAIWANGESSSHSSPNDERTNRFVKCNRAR